jgi:uncharacterized protein
VLKRSLCAVTATCVFALASTSPAFAQITASPPGANPLKVLLVGDSLMVGAKDEIAKSFTAHNATVHFVGKEGTGLLTNQMGWLDLIRWEVRTWGPDIVVIESCCNYATGLKYFYRMADGSHIWPDTSKMFQAWEVAARTAVRIASKKGARVYWVLTPPASTDIYDGLIARRVEKFNEIYTRLGVPLIDWGAALTADGSYTSFLKDSKGNRVRVRTYDGLHITPAGDTRVARLTTQAIFG